MPTLVASYSGFVNGDTPASLTTQPTPSTTATASSPVAIYTISASGAAGPDYAITYTNGSLSVTPAPLTITANNVSVPFGGVIPPLSVSYDGFVNGDSAASLATSLTPSTTATASPAPWVRTGSRFRERSPQLHHQVRARRTVLHTGNGDDSRDRSQPRRNRAIAHARHDHKWRFVLQPDNSRGLVHPRNLRIHERRADGSEHPGCEKQRLDHAARDPVSRDARCLQAASVSSYRLASRRETKRHATIYNRVQALKSASYDPKAGSVTLTLKKGIAATSELQLTIGSLSGLNIASQSTSGTSFSFDSKGMSVIPGASTATPAVSALAVDALMAKGLKIRHHRD